MHEHESFWATPPNWVALAFIVFFVLFGRKLWAVVRGLLDDHADTVKAELAEATRLRTEAEAMLAEATASRATALEDATRLIEGARAEAQRLAAAAAAEAEASAARRERMALDRIAAAEKAVVDEVRMTAADIATRAAAKVIGETLSTDSSAALVDQAIAGLAPALARRAA
jgi:F-type H+-transporting ATPase subunit b